MILQIYAVYDSAAGCFNRPFFLPSNGVAVRSFTDEVNRDAPDNSLFHHASDFVLHCFGSFDDNSGVFEISPRPVIVVRAADVLVGARS